MARTRAVKLLVTIGHVGCTRQDRIVLYDRAPVRQCVLASTIAGGETRVVLNTNATNLQEAVFRTRQQGT